MSSQRTKVFTARRIVTMDPGWPSATAVAVRDGRIVSVGSLDDLKPWLDGTPHDVDDSFADKVLYPGFVDPHQHPLLAGVSMSLPRVAYNDTPNPYGPDTQGAKSKDEVLARLRTIEQALSKDETLLAWGYDRLALGEDLTREELDSVSTDRSVIIWDCSQHNVYVNSLTLKQHDIGRKDTTRPGVEAGADGEPNGQLFGIGAAMQVMSDALKASMAPDVAMKHLRYIVDLNQQGGITTNSEMAVGTADAASETKLLQAFFADPHVPMRCAAATLIPPLVAKLGVDAAIEAVHGFAAMSSDKLRLGSIKFLADEGFMTLTIQMGWPGYCDGREGIWTMEPDQMAEMMLPWWREGFQIHIHTNGDRSQEAVLSALAAMQADHPRFDHRFSFEHLAYSTTAQIRRMKALGAVASVNGYYLPLRGELNEPLIGVDRADLTVRLRSLVDAGVPTAIHADTPIAPAQPLFAVGAAVTRLGPSGRVLAPAERVDLDAALRMVTVDAAFVLGMDDDIGSIEAGKMADFAVLDDDPHDVAPEEIKDITVWGTVFAGDPVPVTVKATT